METERQRMNILRTHRSHTHTSHPVGSPGATLLDTLVGASLLLVVFLGLFGAFQLVFELVQVAKSRTGAVVLAQERMEYIRSLPYSDVGVVGGIPQGNLEPEESETLNGLSYTRRTFVQYTDAPEDGSGGADENGITADYKTVKVTIEWEFRDDTRSFSIVSNIVPPGVESIAGGGTLRITVLDALGAPVPSAQVSLVNNDTAPAVSLSTFTNTSGVVNFPGAPAANSYEVSVSKSGYSSAQTYSVSAENVNPNPGHLTVVENVTTSSSFAIDTTSSLTVRSFEYGSTTPITNVTFAVQGQKTIGTDTNENPLYKYDTTLNTGAGGSVTTSSLEWDNYTISIDDVAEGYDIGESCAPQPIALSPGESETVDIYLAPNTTHSLLVDVKNSDGVLLSGATVRLYRSGYDTSDTTSSCGQIFFNNSLSSGTVSGGNSYSADISLSGYTSQTLSSVEVNGASRLSVILNSL